MLAARLMWRENDVVGTFTFPLKNLQIFSPAYILQNFIIEMETMLEIYG